MKELYNKKINERSIFKYFLGLLSRIRLYLKCKQSKNGY